MKRIRINAAFSVFLQIKESLEKSFDKLTTNGTNHLPFVLRYYGDILSTHYLLRASCRLCNSEMQNSKLHDTHKQLILIKGSTPDFDESESKS
jgi:hypothetical protein